MRATVIAPVAIVAGLMVCGLLALRRSAPPISRTRVQAGIVESTALITANLHPLQQSAKAMTQLPRGESSRSISQPEDDGEIHESFENIAYIGERIEILDELSRSKNPDDLTSILVDLRNPDPRIRRAAVRAAVEFGNPEAIPELQNELASIDDPEEKSSLQRAIEFLQLSSTTAGQ